MAEDEKSFDGHLGKLAQIADKLDELFTGRKAVAFELNREEFVKMRNELHGVNEDQDQFKVDISGNEFIFFLAT